MGDSLYSFDRQKASRKPLFLHVNVVFGFIPSIDFSSGFSYHSFVGELVSIFTAIFPDTIPGKE